MQEQAIAEQAGLDAPILDSATQAECKGRIGGFAIFMDLMFWIDIVLTFRTGVIDNRQVLFTYQSITPKRRLALGSWWYVMQDVLQIIHMKPRFAAVHYVRSWLLVDVLSSFPFDTLVYGVMLSLLCVPRYQLLA